MNDNNGKYNHLSTILPDTFSIPSSESDVSSPAMAQQVPEDIPVIFTTAYDEYAIKAFKVNSVDYLLKPVDEGELEAALQKFERRSAVRNHSSELERLRSDFISRNRKNRFLVQVGDSYQHIGIKDIAYFYSEEKYTFLHLFTGGRYVIGYSLDQLEGMLDPGMFFRVSRGFITSIDAVVESTRYFGNRLVLRLEPEFPQRVLVSRGSIHPCRRGDPAPPVLLPVRAQSSGMHSAWGHRPPGRVLSQKDRTVRLQDCEDSP